MPERDRTRQERGQVTMLAFHAGSVTAQGAGTGLPATCIRMTCSLPAGVSPQGHTQIPAPSAGPGLGLRL